MFKKTYRDLSAHSIGLGAALSGALMLALAGPSFAGPAEAQGKRAPACQMPADAAAQVQGMLAQINVERRQAGLAPLQASGQLQQAAEAIACDNARRDEMTHVDAAGGQLADRVRRTGYGYRSVTENIAQLRATGASTVNAWMGSPPHRANIHDPSAREFGGAVAVSQSGRLYWAALHALGR